MAWANISEFYNSLMEHVLLEDAEDQLHFLEVLKGTRNIDESWLLENGVLFIPNDDYVTYHLGPEAKDPKYGIYLHDSCLWTLCYLIPIRNLIGQVMGFVGWDAKNKFDQEQGEIGLAMYKTSGKNIFKKDNYFLSIPSLLEKEFKKKVVFVVDGVFDCLALNYRGIPTIGMLGSTVSANISFFLKEYDYVYVIKDNDDAGNKLVDRIKLRVPNTFSVSQSKTKDIEALVREEDIRGPVTLQLLEVLEHPRKENITLQV